MSNSFAFRGYPSGKKPFKKLLVAAMLWFFGRAIQAGARVDKAIAKEFSDLPEGFSFSLEVIPDGPGMVVGKDKKGKVKFLGMNLHNQEITLRMRIKNMSAAFLLFTLQEGNAISAARNRLIIDGDIGHACAAIRVLEIVEVYLLPKVLARLALKRYPNWNIANKIWGRIAIYVRAVAGV
ncbi:MAG: hypothetical protein K9K75_02345 [Deltaproteobacteria bacterium]|nr:hypothetical protein [Deltaproteobacteria bacterium]